MDKLLFSRIQSNFRTFLTEHKTKDAPPVQVKEARIPTKYTKEMIGKDLPPMEVRIKSVSLMEETDLFSEGNGGIGYKVLMEDRDGNVFQARLPDTRGFLAKNIYTISGTITAVKEEFVRLTGVKVVEPRGIEPLS